MVFLILCVAVLNLALGFGLALYLQGGRFDLAAGRGLHFGLKLFSWAKDREEELPEPTETESAKTVAANDPGPLNNVIDESAPIDDQALGSTDDDLEELAAANSSYDDDAPLAFRSLAAALPKTEPTSDEPWDRSPSRTEAFEVDHDAIAAAIEAMKSELRRYRGEIAALDGRLRRCAAAPDASTVQACASDLQRANEAYLQQQDSRRDEMRSMAKGGDAAAAFIELARAVEEQAAAVVAAQAGLKQLDLETDLLAQCHQMLDETRQISETSERLHSTIGDALEALADTAGETAAEPVPKPAANNGQAFVAAVESWWQANAGPGRRLAAAMIEPDHLDRLTTEHGQSVVDQALLTFDSIVTSGLAVGQTAARPGGETYLLLMPDASPHEAVRFVERSRQQIDATRFRHGDKKLRLTVSCSVAASDQVEDAAPLVARLEAMLIEAKRYGHNRTFFQEGDISAPAVPPALTIAPRVVDLDAAGG